MTTDKTKTYCENIFNVLKIMTVHYLVAKERNVKNLIRTDEIVLVSSYKSRYFLFHIIVFKNIHLYNNLFVSLRLIILTFLHEFYLLSWSRPRTNAMLFFRIKKYHGVQMQLLFYCLVYQLWKFIVRWIRQVLFKICISDERNSVRISWIVHVWFWYSIRMILF